MSGGEFSCWCFLGCPASYFGAGFFIKDMIKNIKYASSGISWVEGDHIDIILDVSHCGNEETPYELDGREIELTIENNHRRTVETYTVGDGLYVVNGRLHISFLSDLKKGRYRGSIKDIYAGKTIWRGLIVVEGER